MPAQSTYSLSFDGSSGYIALGTNVPQATRVTVSAWIKIPSLPSAIAHVVCWDNSERIFQFRVNASNQIEFIAFVGGSPCFATGGTTLTAGVWYHVAGVYDGTNAIVYLAGASDGSGSASGNLDTHSSADSDMYVGVRVGGGYFPGLIDDVAIIGSALTGGQIASIASGSLDVSSLMTSGLWRFEEGSGTTVADTSGNGHNGVLNGGITWSSDVATPLAGGGGGGSAVGADALHYYREHVMRGAP